MFEEVWKSTDWVHPEAWTPYLYPNKYCDFTDQRVLDRIKSGTEIGEHSSADRGTGW